MKPSLWQLRLSSFWVLKKWHLRFWSPHFDLIEIKRNSLSGLLRNKTFSDNELKWILKKATDPLFLEELFYRKNKVLKWGNGKDMIEINQN